jgi:hypothetical protein
VAADLRKELKVDVELVEGHYGQFSVLVDDAEVFDAGALAFMGVLPSKRHVRELVAQRLAGTKHTPPDFNSPKNREAH